MSLAALDTLAGAHHLSIFGTLNARPEDEIGEGTIALLGPSEPGFWLHLLTQPEMRDGAPDPVDRWSTRVIGGMARDLNGTPLFPFGSPRRPFIGWALRSGRTFQSPVALLVHDTAGLMVSFRGAVFLLGLEARPAQRVSPCDTCTDRPCTSACPVSALTASGYDLDACHAYLDTTAGQSCMSRGCEVRRSCPVSENYGRSERQSQHHMENFHPCR